MMAPSGSRSFRQGCQRVLYWIPVLFIALIVAWSYYAYVLQLCIESIKDTGEKIVYLLVYHIIFLMFVWAYWQTIFTKPMSPSKEFYLAYPDKELLEREDRGESQQEILRGLAKELPIYTRTNSGAIRFCDHCQLLKPDRCHHCSVCDKVNNCVGFSNYKFFILFLAYSLFYCLFITATDLKYFITFWTAGGQAHKRLKEYLNGLPDTQAKFHMMFLFFAAAMFSVSLASLLAYHCWLVCKNRSTLEAVRAPAFRHGIDKNGFSLGFMKNFHQVFGDEMRYWPLPLFSSLGDGCAYPTCLVNQDPEQPSSPTGHNLASQSVAEIHHFPSKPLRESQSRLLTSAPSWTEGDPAGDKDKAGTNNPGMTIENEA